MTDEPSSESTLTGESAAESDVSQLTPNDTTRDLKGEQESHSSDELRAETEQPTLEQHSQRAREETMEEKEVEVQEAVASAAVGVEQQAGNKEEAVAAPEAVDVEIVGESSPRVQVADADLAIERLAPAVPAVQPADEDSEQQTNDVESGPTAADAPVDPSSTTEVTAESIGPQPTSQAKPADDSSISAGDTDTDTAASAAPFSSSLPDSDSGLDGSSTSPAAADTEAETDSGDPDGASSSSYQPSLDAADSSTQLEATLPSAASPPAQPAALAREAAIQVRLLLTGADEPVLVTVSIVREYLSAPKPFLGGYRHHVSGRVKHHASVQTERRQAGRGGGRQLVTRDTQTVDTATRSAQSGRSVGTQMARRDYYIGEEGETGQGERVVQAGEYVGSEVLEAERQERAVRIQCWLRVCFAVRRLKQLAANKQQTESSGRRAEQQAADRRRREEEQQIQRRMHPKSPADFRLLYGELNAWRQHEAERIHTLQLSDEQREQQLSSLLSKEVKLLQTIDRLKIRAAAERKEEATHRRLEMMQSPKEWTTSQGHHVEVSTPYTQRAQELTAVYQALLLSVDMHATATAAAEEKEAESMVADEASSTSAGGCLTWDGRVDVLLHCKYVVGEMASSLSADILQLIEREQEWVRRRHATPGWQADQALAGMRRRLAALFLQFVQTPAYNPEAAVYVDSVGSKEGKQKMQELLRKPLAEREVKKRRPMEQGQERVLTARLQT